MQNKFKGNQKELLEGRGIFNYEGIEVTRLIGGWKVFGQTATTPEEVDEIIMNACSSLSESIVTVPNNNGSMQCSNNDTG